jgi:hypothetical protein
MMELDAKEDLEVAPPVLVGKRQLFVVSETIMIKARKNNLVFGLLISPVYLIIAESDHHYAFSFADGSAIDLDELFLRNPILKEKIFPS